VTGAGLVDGGAALGEVAATEGAGSAAGAAGAAGAPGAAGAAGARGAGVAAGAAGARGAGASAGAAGAAGAGGAASATAGVVRGADGFTSPEAQLILDRCDELGAISSSPDFLERVHLSKEHRAANDLVAQWMADAGLSTWQDAAGNQCGRIEGREPGLPALVLGSHIDTVPDAGRYDGMLGVLLAIATVARLAPRASEFPFALEVVAFSDEEGTRFGTALLGSRAFAGTWNDEWWSLTDKDGISLFEAFTDFGLDPARLPNAYRRPEQLFGYLEAHIEQGPILEDANRQLAVVTSIAGARRFALTMHGKAGHAGGTPYDRRHDALVGAAELVIEVERLSRRHHVIGTVGRLQAYPGGVNVIPGQVDFSLDLRAEYDEDRDLVYRLIQDAAQVIAVNRGLRFEQREIYRADAVLCDTELRGALEMGIRSTGDASPLAFWSRAGHDGMAVVAASRFAMLFVRCGGGGVSHHPDESVRGDDVSVALDAFEQAVIALAN
jgi:allantoate deiminase